MKDLVGQRFHCLTVTQFAHIDLNNNAIWRCQCDCGKTTLSSGARLKNGSKKSCGHMRQEALKAFRQKWLRSSEPIVKVFSGTEIDDALDELEAYS